MRILFLTHSFNSLSQRLYVELTRRGHEVSVEFDINDSVATEAVELFQPDMIIAPYLRRAIPENIWKNHPCMVIHPGPKGDRGPSALDRAIMDGEEEWGVTVLRANGEMDAGDVWAAVNFKMRPACKSGLYRREVAEASVEALLQTIQRFESRDFRPEPLDISSEGVRGKWRPLVKQEERAINWETDSTVVALKKIRAGDGFPGALDKIFGEEFFIFNGVEEGVLKGKAGEIIARRHGAVCRATVDGAVWITHLKRRVDGERTFKLPAAMLLKEKINDVPECPLDPFSPLDRKTYREIYYEEKNGVGYLHFEFHNGAMGVEQCARLLVVYRRAIERGAKAIVLMGGPDFWSNGIHLNLIEAAESPAEESWRNINAMNDLARAVIETEGRLTISAMQGNSGGGGVFLALAPDKVYAREGVVLNPHYKQMGNLYGSEYWTYLLPRRVGEKRAGELTEKRLPVGAPEAKEMGLIDDCFGKDVPDFRARVEQIAEELANGPDLEKMLLEKKRRREEDEKLRPLESYRAAEMERMRLNFFGFDPSYHVARHNFVYKVPHSRTPPHLAKHRRIRRAP
ncbi:MAG: hydrogenase maturation protein [Nitrospinae bacterium]|nr:hydrogenase maturation protein [Nitrospinota bacterium]